MSDETPAPVVSGSEPVDPVPEVLEAPTDEPAGSLREPQGTSPAGAAPPGTPIPALVEPPAEQPPVRQPISELYQAAEPLAEPVGGTSADVAADQAPGAPVAPAVQTVYVTAPVPPKLRGNRGVGTLLAVVATIVFAILLAVIAAIYTAIAGPDGFVTAFTSWLIGFVSGPLFSLPVLVFLILFVLFVLIVNRASWAIYVLGSFLLAVAVYFASIGLLLLLDGMFPGALAGTLSFGSMLANPAIIISAVVAREVAIWFGAGISSRGRRITAKNAEALAEHERETAEKRAEFERAQYGSTA